MRHLRYFVYILTNAYNSWPRSKKVAFSPHLHLPQNRRAILGEVGGGVSLQQR